MNKKILSKTRALLLIFFIVNYSFAGTIPDRDQTPQVIKKYGIDENGRSFEYTVPATGTTPPAFPAPSSRVTPPKSAKRYGIDQNGRSFEYEESSAPSQPATVAVAPVPARQAVSSAHKPARVARQPIPSVATAATPAKKAVTPEKPVAPQPVPVTARTATPQPAASAAAQAPVRTSAPAVADAKTGRPDSGVARGSKVAAQTPSTRTVSPKATVRAGSNSTAPDHGKGEFIVKVSAGNNSTASRSLERDLKKLGARTVKSRVEREYKPVHRLLYARHQDRSRAYLDVSTLHSSGQKAYIICKNETYSVYCGSYYREERARSEQKVIAGRGFRVTITRDSVAVTNKYYMAGGFRSRDAAVKLAGALRQRGMSTTVMSAEKQYAQKSGADDIRG